MRLEINGVDLTQRYTYVTLSGKARVCARTLKTAIVISATDPNFPIPSIRPHAQVKWIDDAGKARFLGVVVAYSRDSTGTLLSVTAMDLGYYLAQNKGYYSFTTTPEAAVRQIAADLGVQTGVIAATGIHVPRKFPGVALHNIINTLYTKASEKTNRQYHIRFDEAALCVVEKPMTATKVLSPDSNIITSTMTVDVTAYINTVEIRSETGKVIQTIGGSEAQAGLLRDVIFQTDGTDAKPEAEAILDAGREQQIVTLECLGDLDLITGNAVMVKETSAGVTGLFWIDGDTHTWKNGVYTSKLELNFRSIMADTKAGEDL